MNHEAIARKIDQCWHAGMSIASTIVAVRHEFSIRVAFEEVHRRFVALSWGALA